MTQALSELKSLKPIEYLINTPLRVRVHIIFLESHLLSPKSRLLSLESCLLSLERERVIAFTLPSIPIRKVSRSRFESLGGKLGFTRLLRFRSSFAPYGFDSGISESKVWFSLALSKSL